MREEINALQVRVDFVLNVAFMSCINSRTRTRNHAKFILTMLINQSIVRVEEGDDYVQGA